MYKKDVKGSQYSIYGNKTKKFLDICSFNCNNADYNRY